MISVSLCMIVKNEEKSIARCLNSAKFIADEIIIIDTGSTDKTKEICRRYTDKIYDFTWIDDFSAARNYAYSFATMDYILWLDADDFFFVEDIVEFIELKNNLAPSINSVMFKYKAGIDLKGNVTFSYFRERLSKRVMKFMWKEPVHEYLEVFGPVASAEFGVTHGKVFFSKSDRNIRIYENVLKNNEKLSPRGRYYYARELREHERWNDAIENFNIFLDSKKGWKEDNIAACNELYKCYMAIGEEEKAVLSLLRSFIYDVPRAEILVNLGYYYQKKEEYTRAIYWFKYILGIEKPKDALGFVQHDFWDYVPCIELAVCYDKLGDIKSAKLYNDMALEMKPSSIQAQINKKYFEEIDI